MRILHTSDWHLGKRLEGKDRLAEQIQAVGEIADIAAKEHIDVIIIAGDVFDTALPSAEAESAFYDCAVRLGSTGATVVALAGNHDDGDRLSAPLAIAKASKLILIGGVDNSALTGNGVEGGMGYVRLTVRGEQLNLAALPFPTEMRLNEMGAEGETYADRVRNALDRCCECFGSGVNILAAHLFMLRGGSGDERELGSAKLLPTDILPCADYIALGHIHKPMTVSSSHRAYYSGALLSYAFDESSGKEVIIYDSDDRSIRHIPISGGKRLVRITVGGVDEARAELAAHAGHLVELTYRSDKPLNPSEMTEFRSCDSFVKLIVEQPSVKSEIKERIRRSPRELFVDYYKTRKGVEPEEELINLFLGALEEA